jgi:phosphoribosylformylglycinamidine synthase
MIRFFTRDNVCYVVQFNSQPVAADIERLEWLFSGAILQKNDVLTGLFLGPRREMITPWSTNAVEICANMGVTNTLRIEEFQFVKDENVSFDKMLQALYTELNQDVFTIKTLPEDVFFINDISAYNQEQGLALSKSEVKYLEFISRKLGRQLSDSEVYGFSQVNSEHCRHKIFNGSFVLDGLIQKETLFDMIKKTTANNPHNVVSAYSDNVAFIQGPPIQVFTVLRQDEASYFHVKESETVLSLKAETHNFPTTVEPFYGASTGSGGEIRDRMAGGKGSIPMAGTAVYCTSYSRHKNAKPWEKNIEARPWLYQTPNQILLKASNGASDFGNKFGQPLICGSVLTFEHAEDDEVFGYDKVIMLAGGIGYTLKQHAQKSVGKNGDTVVLLGGDNYRIGMGGGAVSSVSTGELSNTIELNAVQRANPEMQKRVFNVIRAMVEDSFNPVISVHDHGAGGHLNCLSELVEGTGGIIDVGALPVGDPSLSDKEIICNESQERMGLLLKPKNIEYVRKIAERERAPMYEVGEVSSHKKLIFKGRGKVNPIDLKLNLMFGHPPKATITDLTIRRKFHEPQYNLHDFNKYLRNVLKLESVGCKDWLTNKVDRSVTGRIAMQQCAGMVQLPLNNLGVCAIDFSGTAGMATSIGHAPVAGLIDAAAGSRLAVAEALTNLIWAPLTKGLCGVSLSANWMWASDQPGEGDRLYKGVKGLSDFCIQLGVPVPTGKDSLFMTQKYPNGNKVVAPGTVIVSAAAEVSDVKKVISPVLKNDYYSSLIFIRFTDDECCLGGSAFYQTLGAVGKYAPNISNPRQFVKTFNVVQHFIKENLVLSGHDIGSGGLITSLLEMCFANPKVGLDINLSSIFELDIIKILFSENPGVVIQVNDSKKVIDELILRNIDFHVIGKVIPERVLKIIKNVQYEFFNIDYWREVWYSPSYFMDKMQSGPALAKQRAQNFKNQMLDFAFPTEFKGVFDMMMRKNRKSLEKSARAAIIREKGVNGDREMAYSLYCAGFEVKDVHMTDLISGAETLGGCEYDCLCWWIQ